MNKPTTRLALTINDGIQPLITGMTMKIHCCLVFIAHDKQKISINKTSRSNLKFSYFLKKKINLKYAHLFFKRYQHGGKY